MKRILCVIGTLFLILALANPAIADWRNDFWSLMHKGKSYNLYNYVLERNGSVNMRDRHGYTPIMIAS